jgi:hypothetical protein
MSPTYSFDSLGTFDALERKLSMSAVAVNVASLSPDHLPPPNPDGGPSDPPGDDPPIVYPPIPPSRCVSLS